MHGTKTWFFTKLPDNNKELLEMQKRKLLKIYKVERQNVRNLESRTKIQKTGQRRENQRVET